MNNRGMFTPSQWQELEHQALIFKYLMAGIPVPPDLLLPIRRSFEARIFHHPAMGWGPFYGKKLDPEPGRCRRTDGKKWRCSKDAYPDSKYCERHMHRGRNRSRKPVETQTVSQSSQTVTSLAAAGSSSFQNLPLHSISGSQGSGPGVTASEMQVQHGPYGTSNKDRYLPSLKDEIHGHSFFSEASGSSRGVGMGSSLDSPWHLMPSRVNSFPPSKPRNGSLLQSNYAQLQALEDVGSSSIASALSKEQQQHCFLGSSNYGTAESIKVIREPESQPLRPFFDEWPKTRDSWSDLEDNRSNRTSSTTQLSISIPMSSSDFSGTSSRSPNDD